MDATLIVQILILIVLIAIAHGLVEIVRMLRLPPELREVKKKIQANSKARKGS